MPGLSAPDRRSRSLAHNHARPPCRAGSEGGGNRGRLSAATALPGDSLLAQPGTTIDCPERSLPARSKTRPTIRGHGLFRLLRPGLEPTIDGHWRLTPRRWALRVVTFGTVGAGALA
jgi:hypothetical protein